MCGTSVMTYVSPFITGGIGVVGVYVGYRLSLNNVNRQEFNKASAIFRAEFVGEIALLRKSEKYARGNTAKEIISDAIIAKHERAKILFEPYVGDDIIPSFNKAWENYKNYEHRYQEDKTLNFETDEEMSGYCLRHLESFLEFAKPKR